MATETTAGIVVHATDDEVSAGTNTEKYINPKQLKEYVVKAFGGDPIVITISQTWTATDSGIANITLVGGGGGGSGGSYAGTDYVRGGNGGAGTPGAVIIQYIYKG